MNDDYLNKIKAPKKQKRLRNKKLDHIIVMAYLMMYLERLFGRIAFVDELHFAVEARSPMLEAYVANPYPMNSTVIAKLGHREGGKRSWEAELQFISPVTL